MRLDFLSKKLFFGVLAGIVAIATLVVLYRWTVDSIEAKIKLNVAEIKNNYGVSIHFRYDPKKFFQNTDFHRATGSGASLWHIESILPLISSFLSKYPQDIVDNNLSAIYLLGRLQSHGKSYGATYKGTAIYISIQGRFFRYSNSFITGALHAEFSSILFHKYHFSIKAWEAINDPDWKYVGRGFDMLGKKGLFDQTEELLKKGFLIKYSQSDVENDFNQVVVWIFTKPDRLCELVSNYEKLKKKYLLVIEFYKSIDSRIVLPICRSGRVKN